jgi:hypothetical protein
MMSIIGLLIYLGLRCLELCADHMSWCALVILWASTWVTGSMTSVLRVYRHECEWSMDVSDVRAAQPPVFALVSSTFVYVVYIASAVLFLQLCFCWSASAM